MHFIASVSDAGSSDGFPPTRTTVPEIPDYAAYTATPTADAKISGWYSGQEFGNVISSLGNLDSAECPEQVELASDFTSLVGSVNTNEITESPSGCGANTPTDVSVKALWEMIDRADSWNEPSRSGLSGNLTSGHSENATETAVSTGCGLSDIQEFNDRMLVSSGPFRKSGRDCSEIE